MGRPSAGDWQLIGLDGDPTPGMVESVQALAKQFHDFADDAERAWRDLNSFGADTTALSWVGQSADAFKSNFGSLPGRLQKLYISYREAGDALGAYWPKLQAAQTKADAALRQGLDAHSDVQRTTTVASTAADNLKAAQQNQATSADPNALNAAQHAHDTAQNNLSDAKSRLTAAAHTASQAYDDRISAAKECAKALHHASSDGIHNKHWWEHVGEALSEIGGEIAEVAGELAPILDVIALATSWIPGVDVITAALAEADNLIALAGTVMKIAGDGMQGHWGDALMGAGMLGLQFVGGKAVEKFGGKLLGRLGNRGCTKAGDPVDVVSGVMVAEDEDLGLPGVLPLILRRAYNSGYENGRLFGPGWASTLDQRLAINAGGIHFAGEDAETLTYPVPETSDQAVLPVEGARWPLVWDRDADEIRILDPETGFTRHFAVIHHREERGEIRDLTAVSDRNGNRIELRRDAYGTPIAVEHSAYSVAVDSAVTGAGIRITGIRLLDGSDEGVHVRSFSYDDRGRLVGVTDSSGLPFAFEYDDRDRITAWIDRIGFQYAYTYDADGRVICGTGDGGHLSAAFTYDPANRVTAVTDSLGHTVEYRYDAYGNISSIVDPLGTMVRTEYDVHGRLLSATDALGHRTVYEHDDRGNQTRALRPDGTTVEFEYNALDQITVIRMPGDTEWHQEYDAQGNMVAVTDPTGATTTYSYRDDGAQLSATDALGHVFTFEADAAGLPVATTDPLGATTGVTRDAFGRITAVVEPTGAVSRCGWTVEGLPTWKEGADGARQEWMYDAQGNLVAETDPLGGVTVFEPGPFGQALARTDANGDRYRFDFDTEMKLTSVVNAAGATWTYRYDASGRLVSETDFIGRTLAYDYDAAGRLIGRMNGAGQRIALIRDAAGRVVRRRTPDGEFAFAYDAVGRLSRAAGADTSVAFTRDALGRVTAETVDGRTIGYAYDLAGQRVGRTTPAGAASVWSYDAAGRAVALAAGGSRLAFAYDASGRELERTVGAGTRLTRQLDTVGRPTSLRLWAGDVPDADGQVRPAFGRDWSYRPDGSIAEITDTLRGTRHFRSDASGRVTTITAASWTESYAFDAFGNLSHADTPGDTDVSGPREIDRTLVRRAGRTSYVHDAAGRLVRTVRRTLDGRLRQWEYAWDADDRLVQATTPDGAIWRYAYDPLGRRTRKARFSPDGGSPTEQTVFVWDGMRLAEQHAYGPDGTVRTLTWDYEPDDFRPVAQTRRTWASDADQGRIDAAFHAIVTDLVGTPTELVDEDGRIVWHTVTSLWGRTVSTTSESELDCPLRFPGQYHDDETGLHYNLHRYYDPDTAAYLTPDPLGLAAAPNDHAYVLNPLTWIDPFGLYGAGGGSMCGAANLAKRASDLQKKAGWSGTTSVVKVRSLVADTDGNFAEEVWVASNKKYMPTGWRKNNSLLPHEIFKKGDGHAEETIINSLFNKDTGVQEWGIVEGGTSTGICWGNCHPDLTGNGIRVGGPPFTSSKNNSPWRMFWSP